MLWMFALPGRTAALGRQSSPQGIRAIALPPGRFASEVQAREAIKRKVDRVR
jgi:hypothetical protein